MPRLRMPDGGIVELPYDLYGEVEGVVGDRELAGAAFRASFDPEYMAKAAAAVRSGNWSPKVLQAARMVRERMMGRPGTSELGGEAPPLGPGRGWPAPSPERYPAPGDGPAPPPLSRGPGREWPAPLPEVTPMPRLRQPRPPWGRERGWPRPDPEFTRRLMGG